MLTEQMSCGTPEFASDLERRMIIEQMPQKRPFLFVDRIIALSTDSIETEYRFREDEHFYQGHFPGNPVTPGVILIEVMAQAGLVALGMYLLQREGRAGTLRTLFTECQAEFLAVVPPGETVFVRAVKELWRRNKLRSRVELTLRDGTVAASGLLSGVGAPQL